MVEGISFLYISGDEWHPGIGDPPVVGWVTVAVYAAAAVMCGVAAVRAGAERTRKRFFAVLAGVMAALGVNKQLDLQTWLTLTGKKLAVSEGWYGQRRSVQFAFIILLLACGLGA